MKKSYVGYTCPGWRSWFDIFFKSKKIGMNSGNFVIQIPSIHFFKPNHNLYKSVKVKITIEEINDRIT